MKNRLGRELGAPKLMVISCCSLRLSRKHDRRSPVGNPRGEGDRRMEGAVVEVKVEGEAMAVEGVGMRRARMALGRKTRVTYNASIATNTGTMLIDALKRRREMKLIT